MSQKKYEHRLHLNIPEALERGEELLDSFPELAAYPEFSVFRGKELNKFIVYCFYAYDPGSWFVCKLTKDISKRKEEAAKEAGLNLKDERVLAAMAMEDEEVNAMITRFFRSFIKSQKFELWVSGCEMIAQLQEEVRTPISKKDLKEDAAQRANKIRMENYHELPGLIEKTEKLESDLFGNDKALKETAVEAAQKINQGSVERYLSRKKEQ